MTMFVENRTTTFPCFPFLTVVLVNLRHETTGDDVVNVCMSDRCWFKHIFHRLKMD